MLYYNPNSLRPYHTLGPVAGPTCSKILTPPLHRPNSQETTTNDKQYVHSVAQATVLNS